MRAAIVDTNLLMEHVPPIKDSLTQLVYPIDSDYSEGPQHD